MKNMFIHQIDDIVKEYSNTYHTKIKMKSVNVKSSINNGFNVENNNKDPEFEVDDNVRISKCKNIFEKGYCPSWSEEAFMIKTVKNTVS